jgi:hypothetical protein
MDASSSPLILGVVAVVAVCALSFTRGAARRQLLHKERMSALEKGVPLPEDADAELEAGARRGPAAASVALQGVVLAALGLGMLAANWFAPAAELSDDMRRLLAFLQIWAWPALFVGVAMLVFAFFARQREGR